MTPATARGLVRRVGPDPDPAADADLVGRFARAADPAAFAALVRRHGPMVLAVCRRMLPGPADADDAFQAVFLVLLRKAAAVRPPGAVGGWLHGVAVRTAQKARVAAARRRRREMSVASNPGRGSAAAVVPASAEHAELRAVLDEELARLPEALRTAVVLCDLGGKTRAEAAADLGCPEGTVAARLHRARKLLADRLARRGVTAPAGLAVAAAAVPGDLFAAVAGFAAGGPVPPAVRALAEGVVRSMVTHPLSIAFAAVAAAALAAGAGVLWAAGAPSPDGATPTAEAAETAEPANPASPVTDLAFDADGTRYLVLAGGKVAVRDAATDKTRWVAPAEAARFTRTPAGRDDVATLTADGVVLRGAVDGTPHGRTAPRPKAVGGWRAVRFSADGTRYAAHTGAGVLVFETTTGAEAGALAEQYGPGDRRVVAPKTDVFFSPDGRKVVGVGVMVEPGNVGLADWELATGNRRRATGGDPRPTAAAYSPNNDTIAVGYADRIVLLSDMATGPPAPDDGKPERTRLRPHKQLPPAAPVTALAFGPDGKTVAAGIRGGAGNVAAAVQLLDAATGKELRRFGGFADDAAVTALAFAPDGKTLLAGTSTGEVKRFALADPPDVRPVNFVTDLSFAPDGKRYAVVAGAKVAVKDAATDRVVWDAPGQAARFTPDGAAVLTIGKDEVRRVAATGGVLQRYPRGKTDFEWHVAAFSPDGTRYAGHTGIHARLYDTATGFEPVRLTPDPGTPGGAIYGGPSGEGVAFSPDGKLLTAVGVHVGNSLMGASVWDTATGKRVFVTPDPAVASFIGRPPHPPTAAAFSPDGKSLAVAFGKTVRLFETGKFAEQAMLPDTPGSGPVTALAFSPDGKLLAVGYRLPLLHGGKVQPEVTGHKTEVQLIDLATKKEVRRFDGFEGVSHMGPTKLPVTALAFSPDGQTLLAGTGVAPFSVLDPKDVPPPAGGEVRRFNLAAPAPGANPPAAWRPKGALPPFDDRVQSVTFSPDGKALAVGGRGGPAQQTVTMWDAATLKKLWAGGPVPAGTTGVSFSGDARLLAATRDKTTGLYDPATGQPVPMDPPLPGGKAVAFSHAAERVAGRPVHKLAVTDGSKTSVLTWIEGGAPGTATFGPLADAAKITGPTPAGVAFSPDGRQVVFIPNAKTPPAEGGKWYAQVWGGGSGAKMALLPHGLHPVTAVAWSPDGKHIATGCRKGDVVVWDAATFKELRRTRLGGRTGEGVIHALAFAPDGKALAAAVDLRDAKNASRVALLDPATGERRGADLQGFGGLTPVSVAFCPDGATLAVGLADFLPPAQPPLEGAARPLGGVALFTTAPEPPAAPPAPVWREKAAQPLDRMPVYSVAFRPDGKSLAVGSRTGGPSSSVTTWTADTLAGQWGDAPSPEGKTRVAYSPSGPLLAATRETGTTLRDAASGKAVATDAPLPGGRAVAFGLPGPGVAGRPRHKLAVSDGLKTSVLTWVEGGPVTTATFGPLKDAPKVDDPPAGVAFSPSGEQLVFIPNARTPPAEGGKWFAQVWGGGSGRPAAVLPHGTAPVTAVAWSPDGKHVATACELGDVVVWDAATFKELRRTRIGGRTGTGHVHALEFAPDGKTLAAAVDLIDAKNAERVVMLDPATGERVGTDIQGFAQAAPRALAFAPDGKALAVGCVAWEVVNTRVVGEHGLVKLYTTDP